MSHSHGMDAARAQNLPGREYLTFRLGSEEYGVEILKVQEIRGYETATRLAGAPDHVKGVINLRGVIVPVIDMRIRFGLPCADYDQFTVVIILSLSERVVGMVVDGVSDVLQLGAADIQPAPGFGAVLDTTHIVGLGTVNDRMLIVLDIEKLMQDVGTEFSGNDAAPPAR